MKELTFLHDELATMREWQGECKRMELYAVTTEIAVIEKTLKAAQEKIAQEHAEELAWAYKAEKANYKDAEANIAEFVYGTRVGWYRTEVAKMKAELKKLRRKATRLSREIDKFDAEAKRFNNGTLKPNSDTEAKQHAC